MRGAMTFSRFLLLFILGFPESMCAYIHDTFEHPSFESFIQLYGREYKQDSPEFQIRKAIYEASVAKIQHLNSRLDRLWTAGVNELSDWTAEELGQLHGWKGAKSNRGIGKVDQHFDPGSMNLRQTHRAKSLPENMSWAHLESSKRIHNQGACGSCWAVTSATVLDGHAEIYLGSNARRYSAQELVSCSENEHHCGGTGGCQGSTVELAMNYAMRNGIATEHDFPYTGTDSSCKVRSKKNVGVVLASGVDGDELDPDLTFDELVLPGLHLAKSQHMPGLAAGIKGWERLPENKYQPLLKALVELGPVGVSVAAGSWYSYMNGIYDGCRKDVVIGHAVTLIGYGKDPDVNQKYWLIQNSWGAGWGEKGYMRLLRRDAEEEWCGIDSAPAQGTGCDGGPNQVKVCGACGILYDTVVPVFLNSSTSIY